MAPHRNPWQAIWSNWLLFLLAPPFFVWVLSVLNSEFVSRLSVVSVIGFQPKITPSRTLLTAMAAEEAMDVTSPVPEIMTEAATEWGKGVARIKAEFLDKDYVRELDPRFLSAADQAKLKVQFEGVSNVFEASKTESDEKKQPKLKGRNKNRRKQNFRENDKICSFIVKEVFCPYGEKCRFSHDVKNYLVGKKKDLGEKCPIFEKKGFCTYGVTCRFAESHLDPQGRNFRPENFDWNSIPSDVINGISKDTQRALRKRKFQFGEGGDKRGKSKEEDATGGAAVAEIDSAGGAAVAEIDSAGGAAVVEIDTAGGAAVVETDTAGGAAVAEVDSAGGAAVVETNPAGGAAVVETNPAGGAAVAEIDSAGGAAVVEIDTAGGAAVVETDTAGGAAVAEVDSAGGAAVVETNPAGGAAVVETNPAGGAAVAEVDSAGGAAVVNGENKEEIKLVKLVKLIGSVTDEDEIPLRESEKKKLNFYGKLYLSPLTTVGNLPFRRICKEFGAEITCGEMALVGNLLSGQQSEWALTVRHSSEDLFGVQVCGSKPDDMEKLAHLLKSQVSVDFVDINSGCPIDLVCKSGSGCALMGRGQRLEGVVKKMVRVLDVPLTVKIRTGIYDGKNIAHEIIPKLREWGAGQVSLHGRSKEQRYTKLADWKYIAQCAEIAQPLPLFGNGDVMNFEDYYDHLENTKVSGMLIARGALMKPWLFTEIKERRHWDISAQERFDMFKQFTNYGLEHWGSDTRGVETTRRFLLEWMSFTHRYIPVGVLEQPPQRINERPPHYIGRSDLETLLSSAHCNDWIKVSEMLLGPVVENFQFLPKHKANAWK